MLTLMDWFCGAGGSSQGAHAVPGVHVTRAANHWERAIESHSANFPDTDHYLGDIRTAPVERWPVADIFWASPECPTWSNARGKRRDFDNTLQGSLFEELEPPRDEEVERSRALMEEVPMYLRGVHQRGGRVLAGVVENVVDVWAWDQWNRWVWEIRALGYRTRLIAMNSMHALPVRTLAAPQSRDRLYLAYWHESLGRDPDWDKWLRPQAWCPRCDRLVDAVQVFKRPGVDMGRYRQQYVYRCPHISCRGQVVEPGVLPAAAAIDWSIPGRRIGDRDKPLAPKTLARIRAGLERYAVPVMTPAGGTWRQDASPVTVPMPTRTTRECDGIAITPYLVPLRSGRNRTILAHAEPLATIVADGANHGLAVPPLLVPVEGRDGKEASPATEPMRTQTARNETGLAWLPFVTELRGGSCDARPVTEALSTVTASGNHHGLVTPPLDRYAVVNSSSIDLDDVLFRMLEPHEIGRAMAFADGYVVVGNKREKVRQYGNAVTPNVAEIIISALVEAITGEDLERAA